MKQSPPINWDKAGLGDRLDSEIARDFNVPRRRVTKERAKRNIQAFTKRSRNPVATATKPVTQVVVQTPVSVAPEPPKTPAPKKVRLKNYIAIVLDKSGSMADYQHEVQTVFQGLARTIADNASANDQDTVVSLFTFANRSERVFSNEHPETLARYANFYPGGMTALFDGVGDAIEFFQRQPDANQDHVSFLVIVLTDGEENSSQRFNGGSLKTLITKVHQTDRWSLVFQVPPNHKKALVQNFGIPSDNVREWEQTTKGFQETAQHTNTGVTSYFASRSLGQTKVDKFYVTTDLSKLTAKDVTSKLTDVSDRFKSYRVEKEIDISPFVHVKTGRPYVVGSAYFLLAKKEEIQGDKEILIMEKGKKAIYGGSEARNLIGLPAGVTAKVTPGNHSNFDIYVQSRSVNRKLQRGTVVLVDVTKTTNDKETWDSSKVTK